MCQMHMSCFPLLKRQQKHQTLTVISIRFRNQSQHLVLVAEVLAVKEAVAVKEEVAVEEAVAVAAEEIAVVHLLEKSD